MIFHVKLVIVHGKPFQPSLMSGKVYKGHASLLQNLWITDKKFYNIGSEAQCYKTFGRHATARGKHFNIFSPFVSYIENEVFWIWHLLPMAVIYNVFNKL